MKVKKSDSAKSTKPFDADRLQARLSSQGRPCITLNDVICCTISDDALLVKGGLLGPPSDIACPCLAQDSEAGNRSD